MLVLLLLRLYEVHTRGWCRNSRRRISRSRMGSKIVWRCTRIWGISLAAHAVPRRGPMTRPHVCRYMLLVHMLSSRMDGQLVSDSWAMSRRTRSRDGWQNLRPIWPLRERECGLTQVRCICDITVTIPSCLWRSRKKRPLSPRWWWCRVCTATFALVRLCACVGSHLEWFD